MPSAPNILVISDLHLGEDVKPDRKAGFLRHVVLLERELESFLEHYTSHRGSDRPWKLIINGDMVDFLAVWLRPGETHAATGHFGDVARSAMVARGAESTARLAVADVLDDEDQRELADRQSFGLGSDAEGAAAKMEAVGKRHSGVFARLAGFLAAGNEVVIIMGNHDVEFHWPEVQQKLRDILDEHLPAEARAQAQARVSFSPWFYYEENLVWIEHGHQYDEYCSFDYWLNPVAPARKATRRPGIIMSLGGAGMRYFANLMPDMNVYNQEDWSTLDYMRWGFAKGVRGVLRLLWLYFYLFYQLARGCRFIGHKAFQEARRVVHFRRLRELAGNASLSEQTLIAVDAMRRRPVILNLLKLMQTLMIDRLILGFLTVVGEVLLFVFLPWPHNAIFAGGLIAFVAAVMWWSARGRQIDATDRLRAMSKMIRKHVRAKFVVMGHTHEPSAVPLGDEAWYFNTGTWVATEKPGLMRSFTHLFINRDRGGVAELRRWSSVDGESKAFDPSARVAGGYLIADSHGGRPRKPRPQLSKDMGDEILVKDVPH